MRIQENVCAYGNNKNSESYVCMKTAKTQDSLRVYENSKDP